MTRETAQVDIVEPVIEAFRVLTNHNVSYLQERRLTQVGLIIDEQIIDEKYKVDPQLFGKSSV